MSKKKGCPWYVIPGTWKQRSNTRRVRGVSMSRNGVVPSRNACVLRGQIAKTNSTGVGPPNALPPVWVLTKDRWPSDTYIFHVQPPGWEMLPMCCVLCVLTVRRPQTKTLLSVICAISATTLAGLSHISLSYYYCEERGTTQHAQ